MVKNLLVGSCVALVVSSFSFWKMERLYKGYSSDYASILLSKDKNRIPYNESDAHFPCSAMLYEENTSIFFKNIPYPIVFTCRDYVLEANYFKKREDLLLCDFDYDNNFWTTQNLKKINRDDELYPYSYCSFIYGQRLPLVFRNGLAAISSNIIDIEMLEYGRDITNALNRKNGITIRKEWFSSSHVRVSNLFNQVLLTKHDKTIHLGTALKNYFKKPSPDINLNQDYLNCTKENNRVDFNFLKESTILAVWSLIPVETNLIDNQGNLNKGKIESQMLGLAQDKDGKLFHWATDLRNDISILMEYAPDISHADLKVNKYSHLCSPDV